MASSVEKVDRAAPIAATVEPTILTSSNKDSDSDDWEYLETMNPLYVSVIILAVMTLFTGLSMVRDKMLKSGAIITDREHTANPEYD